MTHRSPHTLRALVPRRRWIAHVLTWVLVVGLVIGLSVWLAPSEGTYASLVSFFVGMLLGSLGVLATLWINQLPKGTDQ